jgi:hypothetical protein
MIESRRWIAIAAVAVIESFALPASAQTASDSDRAEKLFTEASALVEQGNYAEACPKFAQSQELDPALGTQYNLALCYEQIGQLGSAWRNFAAVARLAHEAGKAGREKASREKMAALRERAPHLVISVVENDITIKVDGEIAEPSTWSYYPVDPGQHTIDVTASAREPWKTTKMVTGSAGSTLIVNVPKLVSLTGGAQVVTEAPSSALHTVGFVIGGIGIAGVAAAVVTGILILDDKSTADASCKPTCVDQAGRDAVNRGTTLLPINAVAWGVGLAGLGAGIIMVLIKPSRPTAAAAWLAPTFGGVTLGGRF